MKALNSKPVNSRNKLELTHGFRGSAVSLV